jgi:hypothetical protein
MYITSPHLQVTQLGHVKDLATAFVKCLGNEKAYGQIYNISGGGDVFHNMGCNRVSLVMSKRSAKGRTSAIPISCYSCHMAGERYVTFNGIAKACAKAAGAPEPEIINYNPKVCSGGR